MIRSGIVWTFLQDPNQDCSKCRSINDSSFQFSSQFNSMFMVRFGRKNGDSRTDYLSVKM